MMNAMNDQMLFVYSVTIDNNQDENKRKTSNRFYCYHTVNNTQLLRHPLTMDNLIFALLSKFLKQYSRIYLLGHFSEKCSQIYLKTKQERTIKI